MSIVAIATTAPHDYTRFTFWTWDKSLFRWLTLSAIGVPFAHLFLTFVHFTQRWNKNQKGEQDKSFCALCFRPASLEVPLRSYHYTLRTYKSFVFLLHFVIGIADSSVSISFSDHLYH